MHVKSRKGRDCKLYVSPKHTLTSKGAPPCGGTLRAVASDLQCALTKYLTNTRRTCKPVRQSAALTSRALAKDRTVVASCRKLPKSCSVVSTRPDPCLPWAAAVEKEKEKERRREEKEKEKGKERKGEGRSCAGRGQTRRDLAGPAGRGPHGPNLCAGGHRDQR